MSPLNTPLCVSKIKYKIQYLTIHSQAIQVTGSALPKPTSKCDDSVFGDGHHHASGNSTHFTSDQMHHAQEHLHSPTTEYAKSELTWPWICQRAAGTA